MRVQKGTLSYAIFVELFLNISELPVDLISKKNKVFVKHNNLYTPRIPFKESEYLCVCSYKLKLQLLTIMKPKLIVVSYVNLDI
jgi:hypothetical protein